MGEQSWPWAGRETEREYSIKLVEFYAKWFASMQHTAFHMSKIVRRLEEKLFHLEMGVPRG